MQRSGAEMRVVEIFTSFQGEGKHQGARCTFLRLAGCNLACRWCDTPDAQNDDAGDEISTEQIIARIRSSGVRYLCVTGGEPLLQMDELLPVLQTLFLEDYRIEIETNGTVPFTQVLPYASVCMDVKCPSSGEMSDLSLLADIRQDDTVKFVVADETDLAYADEQIRSHSIAGEIFISPVFGSDYSAIARTLIAWDHPIRLQMQLHKQIGVQ